MTDQYVPRLRRRFLEDMRIKGLQSKTQTMYLRAMREFPRADVGDTSGPYGSIRMLPTTLRPVSVKRSTKISPGRVLWSIRAEMLT